MLPHIALTNVTMAIVDCSLQSTSHYQFLSLLNTLHEIIYVSAVVLHDLLLSDPCHP